MTPLDGDYIQKNIWGRADMEFLFERVSAANKWGVELNTRREISYLQVTMYYFVYHINTITLYWPEKSTLLTNEMKDR